MKKILLVIPSLVGGGAERVMTTMANNFCKDCNVEILTLTSKDCFYKLDSRVKLSNLGCSVNRKNKLTTVFTKLQSAFRGFFGIAKAVKTKKPDTIIAFLGSVISPLVILKALGLIKSQVIVSERADPTVRSKFSQWFERTFYPKADIIVCQAEQVKMLFDEKYREKCIVIPNPISADAIPPVYTGERRKIVVGVGRLAPQKNFSLLIKAFSRLPADFDEYKLQIYGGGPYESTLNKQIEVLNMQDRITLMGIKKNVMFEIADAELFVMSSNYEGFPNALVESMATGLPVISTDFSTGVAHEIIGDKNGIVIPVGDEDALVAAMTELLSDPQRRAEMSVENRKYLDKLSEDTVMTYWKNII